MLLQAFNMRVKFWTKGTLKRFLSGVNFYVSSQVTLIRKCFVANVATEGFLHFPKTIKKY
jgi:hypothetical protein